MKIQPTSSRVFRKSRRKSGARVSKARATDGAQWTFLTNHAHVLILLARDPRRLLRELARDVGITERAVQRIIVDLEAAGVIERQKIGRQNRYQIHAGLPLRHPIEAHRTIADLIRMDCESP